MPQSRIVVIEDNPMISRIYQHRLAAQGYEVHTASGGRSGLSLIYRVTPDLVLLDLLLPDLGGLEVLKLLRAQPLFKATPVVVFSTTSAPDLAQRAHEAGATLLLSKATASPNQVLEAIRTALLAA